MKPSELRIGNFITYDNIVYEVVGVNKVWIDCVDKYGDHRIIHSSDIHPVILTDELLENAGFIREVDSDYFHNGNFCLKKYTGWYMYISGINGLISIIHLHQLQNAFHAIAKEELKITKV